MLFARIEIQMRSAFSIAAASLVIIIVRILIMWWWWWALSCWRIPRVLIGMLSAGLLDKEYMRFITHLWICRITSIGTTASIS